MAGLLTFQSGPKGTKMVNLSVFDHLGPFWAHMDPFGPFQTKMNCLPLMDKVGFGEGAFGAKKLVRSSLTKPFINFLVLVHFEAGPVSLKNTL